MAIVTRDRLRAVALVMLLAAPLLASTACSDDPAAPETADDSCQEVGLLVICGADTTRVDESGG